jgi:hypothetical protein
MHTHHELLAAQEARFDGNLIANSPAYHDFPTLQPALRHQPERVGSSTAVFRMSDKRQSVKQPKILGNSSPFGDTLECS